MEHPPCDSDSSMSFSLFEVFKFLEEDSAPAPPLEMEDLLGPWPWFDMVSSSSRRSSEDSSESGMLAILVFGDMTNLRLGWWVLLLLVMLEGPLELGRGSGNEWLFPPPNLPIPPPGPNKTGSVFLLCRSPGWLWPWPWEEGEGDAKESVERFWLLLLIGAGVWVWATDKYLERRPWTWVLIIVVNPLYPKL